MIYSMLKSLMKLKLSFLRLFRETIDNDSKEKADSEEEDCKGA